MEHSLHTENASVRKQTYTFVFNWFITTAEVARDPIVLHLETVTHIVVQGLTDVRPFGPGEEGWLCNS